MELEDWKNLLQAACRLTFRFVSRTKRAFKSVRRCEAGIHSASNQHLVEQMTQKGSSNEVFNALAASEYSGPSLGFDANEAHDTCLVFTLDVHTPPRKHELLGPQSIAFS